MAKIHWASSALLFLAFGANAVFGDTQAQCEAGAKAGYEYCLQYGIPCVPGMPNCVPHKGSPALCSPAYKAALQRCQPSFNWTQIPDPSSNSPWPPARAFAAYWTDAQGFFWLFGGRALNVPAGSPGTAFPMNDLWRFSPGGPGSSGTWKLMGGSNQVGTVSTSSMPGGRMETAFAVDAQGKVWLFGGNGFGPGSTAGFLNDLWEFTPGPGGGVGTWKMMSGGNAVNNVGNYGTQGVASTANVPSGRSDAVCWFDSNGNFWLFGGLGFSSGVVGG